VTSTLPPGREPLASVLRSGDRNPVQFLLLALIRAYQLMISPLLGPVCRFYPSCSNYGFEAIRVHGALRGTWLTARRVLRCHPWNPGGVDLVPPRAAKDRSLAAPAVAQSVPEREVPVPVGGATGRRPLGRRDERAGPLTLDPEEPSPQAAARTPSAATAAALRRPARTDQGA
jgi:uncharacterized protein